MKDLYAELYKKFKDDKYKVKIKKDNEYYSEYVGFDGLSHFIAIEGDEYKNQEMRLMIIGRAVNGWDSISAVDESVFGKKAQNIFNQKGFKWLKYDANEGGLHTENNYRLSHSSFWRTSKSIWEELSGKSKERWVEYIAWSNIYKVAPPETGNPSSKMCSKQIEICRDILIKEIENYKPTHILFVTGWNYWFHSKVLGVDKLFDDCKFIAENNKKNKVYVEGTAVYKKTI